MSAGSAAVPHRQQHGEAVGQLDRALLQELAGDHSDREARGHRDGVLAADIRPLVRLNCTLLVEHNGKRERGTAGGGARVGYGYFLIHANNVNTDDIESFYISEADVRKYVTPSSVVVQYPTGGSAKRIDVKIETPKFTFKVNIRNKQGGIFPSHIMCDYKVKH